MGRVHRREGKEKRMKWTCFMQREGGNGHNLQEGKQSREKRWKCTWFIGEKESKDKILEMKTKEVKNKIYITYIA